MRQFSVINGLDPMTALDVMDLQDSWKNWDKCEPTPPLTGEEQAAFLNIMRNPAVFEVLGRPDMKAWLDSLPASELQAIERRAAEKMEAAGECGKNVLPVLQPDGLISFRSTIPRTKPLAFYRRWSIRLRNLVRIPLTASI